MYRGQIAFKLVTLSALSGLDKTDLNDSLSSFIPNASEVGDRERLEHLIKLYDTFGLLVDIALPLGVPLK